jgi:hypothetical protein
MQSEAGDYNPGRELNNAILIFPKSHGYAHDSKRDVRYPFVPTIAFPSFSFPAEAGRSHMNSWTSELSPMGEWPTLLRRSGSCLLCRSETSASRRREAGRGLFACNIKMLLKAFFASRKSPHPPFGHLLPSSGREKGSWRERVLLLKSFTKIPYAIAPVAECRRGGRRIVVIRSSLHSLPRPRYRHALGGRAWADAL